MKIRKMMTTMLFASATAVVCGALVVGLTTAGCGARSSSAPSPSASAVASASSSPVDGHSTRDSVDWQGYYYGPMPAADCPGIEAWLHLDEVDGKVKYELIETYLTGKPQTFTTSGVAVWESDGSTLTLTGDKDDAKHPRKVFVSEGFVQFLGENQAAIESSSPYSLKKQDVFTGGGRQILVAPSSVKVDGKRVSFDGVINYKKRAEGGYKSVAAHFVVDTAARRYEMQRVVYYHDAFATGTVVREVKRVAHLALRFSGDDVVAQAVSSYRSGN